MQVECIAECSLGAFCNTFDLYQAVIGLENHFCLVFEWPLKTGFTVLLYGSLHESISEQQRLWRICAYARAFVTRIHEVCTRIHEVCDKYPKRALAHAWFWLVFFHLYIFCWIILHVFVICLFFSNLTFQNNVPGINLTPECQTI